MTPPRAERLVIGLCFAVIVFDGYDLIVYGATVPALLAYEPWGLTPTSAGAIGSYALVGMLIGALLAGALTDVVGRRKVLVAGVTWFSVAMAGCHGKGFGGLHLGLFEVSHPEESSSLEDA